MGYKLQGEADLGEIVGAFAKMLSGPSGGGQSRRQRAPRRARGSFGIAGVLLMMVIAAIPAIIITAQYYTQEGERGVEVVAASMAETSVRQESQSTFAKENGYKISVVTKDGELYFAVEKDGELYGVKAEYLGAG